MVRRGHQPLVQGLPKHIALQHRDDALVTHQHLLRIGGSTLRMANQDNHDLKANGVNGEDEVAHRE
eukprot:4254153-Lingulodinium_polyedra.AAC.1